MKFLSSKPRGSLHGLLARLQLTEHEHGVAIRACGALSDTRCGHADGGLKTFGHPTGATGVRMLYENYKQLQGKADKRQVKNATLAPTHNLGGAPQTCGMTIIGMP